MDTSLSPEEAKKAARKEVIKITVYLSVITIIELILGYVMMGWEEGSFKRHFVKGIIIILMLWKAFYIVAYFMHLKHENKNFRSIILLPLSFFVWFIIAFLADGSAALKARQKYDAYSVEMNKRVVPENEHGHHGAAEEHVAAPTAE